MKSFEKKFQLVEILIVAIFISISYLMGISEINTNNIIILILSLILTVLASALNIAVLIFQREKYEKNK